MKMKSTALVAVGALSMAMWAATPAQAHCGKCGHGAAEKDIVDTAVAAGQFETLVTCERRLNFVARGG